MKRLVHKITPTWMLRRLSQGFYICNADIYSDGSKYWRLVTCKRCLAKRKGEGK